MNIPKLRIFYEVAKTGSLKSAAVKFNFSISNISRQIGLFEKELDIILFHRNGRKLTLTSQGEMLYQQCPIIFNAAQLFPKEPYYNYLQDQKRTSYFTSSNPENVSNIRKTSHC